MSLGIDVEHPVPHVHTKNGLAESLIKRLKLIARPLIMRTKLPISVWGHAVLHAAALVKIRPSAYHMYYPNTISICPAARYIPSPCFWVCGLCPYSSATKNENETPKEIGNI